MRVPPLVRFPENWSKPSEGISLPSAVLACCQAAVNSSDGTHKGA